MLKLIRAKFLVPLGGKSDLQNPIEDGYVLFEESKILEVGAFDHNVQKRIVSRYAGQVNVIGYDPDDDKIEELNKEKEKKLGCVKLNSKECYCHQGILLPGFIKAHGHDHESPIIGIERDVPLTTWLDNAVNLFTQYINNNYERLANDLGESPNYYCYLKSRLDDVYYGITSSMVHQCNYAKNHTDDLVRANKEVGTRITVAVGAQDRNFYKEMLDTPSKAISRLDDYLKKYNNKSRIQIIPGPDQGFSNGPEMLKSLKKWSLDHNTLFHIHSSEELNTTNWFKSQYKLSPVEYLYDLGVLDEKTILAHQVHCTQRDLEIISKTGANVVHNPTANTILGSGMPPILEMMKQNINVAIATDGSGSSDNQNIIAAAKLASQYQKALNRDATVLPARQVLEMITTIPAGMLGLNAGSLEPEKDADMILIDLTRPNLIPTTIDNVIENLIWAADGSEVNLVIAGGRLIMRNKKVVDKDTNNLMNNIDKIAVGFNQYRKTAPKITGTGIHQNKP